MRVRINWRAPVPGVCLFGVREILPISVHAGSDVGGMAHALRSQARVSDVKRWFRTLFTLHQPVLFFVKRKKERKQTNPDEGWGRTGQGPHLHEQDFGRTIRGTGGALLLLTRDTTGSQRGARWAPNSTGGLISV